MTNNFDVTTLLFHWERHDFDGTVKFIKKLLEEKDKEIEKLKSTAL